MNPNQNAKTEVVAVSFGPGGSTHTDESFRRTPTGVWRWLKLPRPWKHNKRKYVRA